MDCKVANRLIVPFLENELELDEADKLLEHVGECSGCREDLEIYYMVRKGIVGLDQDQFENFDLKNQFENDLKKAERRVRIERAFLLFHGTVLLAAFAAAAIAAFIQITRLF